MANASMGGDYNLPENKKICFEIWIRRGNCPDVGQHQSCWFNDH